MSNYHYCLDCKQPTDLVQKEVNEKLHTGIKYVCKWCGSPHVKIIIDK